MYKDTYTIFNWMLSKKFIFLDEKFLYTAIDRSAVEIAAKILELSDFPDYTPFVQHTSSRENTEKNYTIRLMLQEKIAEKLA